MTSPNCGFTFRGKTCLESESHHCEPRADKVIAFFSERLVHTKGVWARQPFIPSESQEHDILRPLFGEVVWSDEYGRYIRRYRVAIIVLARKNGKSEIAAGIVLYLLVADDEEGAEIYGAAKDTKQAGKVFEPAWRMVELSPHLRKQVKLNKHSRRMFYEKRSSYYEIITSDALGELGHNPHGFVLDEALSQPDDSLWNAMRTAAGTRAQPLMLLITTETNDQAGFGAQMIDEAEKIQSDALRAPHIFAYVRKTPKDADPWDESNWFHANPALGDFLSVQSLREEALEARNDPTKENAFRQFRLNQRVQQVSRWMNLELWDASAGLVDESALKGKRAYGGLDLASSRDIAALTWVFPAPGGAYEALWRFWTPQAQLSALDKRTSGKASTWVKQGFLTATPGDVIDYKSILAQIDKDLRTFDVPRRHGLTYDRWGMTQLAQDLQELAGDDEFVSPIGQGFKDMSPPIKELERLILLKAFRHGGNPVMRWMFDNIATVTDPAGNVKFAKNRSADKIDGAVAAVMALACAQDNVVMQPATLVTF